VQNLNININEENKIKNNSTHGRVAEESKDYKITFIEKGKFEKCKKFIVSRLSLEYIMKQFYILENYLKFFVDENEIFSKDFLFDLDKKIPYKILKFRMMNEKVDSGPKFNDSNIELNMAGGSDQSQCALKSNIINKLQLN
jgi:hypothetical protein